MAGSTGKTELDAEGREIFDPTPLSIPAGFKRPETLAEQVRRLVRQMSNEAEAQGLETFEDSEDFELPDDPDDPSTIYEEYFDPALGRHITAQEFKENFDVYKQRLVDAEMRAWAELDRSDALRRRPREEPKSSRAASERVGQDGGKAASKEAEPEA